MGAKDQAAPMPGTFPLPTGIDSAVRQAQALRRNGDFQAAAKTLSQLVLIAPDDSRVLSEYAKTLIAEGRSDDALAFLERAIELQPGDWSLYSAQGVAYDQKGNYQAAQASYDRALALKPGDPTVLSNAALSHMQAGDLAGAEKLLTEAARAGAQFPRIASNLALVQSLKGSSLKELSLTPAAQAQLASPAPAKAQAAVPPQPVQAQAPTPIPAAASAPATLAAAMPSMPRSAPVESVPLPASQSGEHFGEPLLPASAMPMPELPVSANNAPAGQAHAGGLSIEKLKADPTVRLQAVPKDGKAGPVAPKNVVAKKAAPPSKSAAGHAAEAPALRPTLFETEPGREANARP
jgi:Flp pilus assembly protein TadD